MRHDSEFDIVVWGATGFTGRLTAEKLAGRIGNRGDLRWAIGGRNQSKLESVRSQLGAAAADIPIIMFTRHDEQEAVVLGLQTGAVDYIPKDAFADAVLLETLRQMKLIG